MQLNKILAAAYQARIMGHGDVTSAFAQFEAMKDDVAFMEEARAELGRLKNINSKRCFASKVSADFLSEALSRAESK